MRGSFKSHVCMHAGETVTSEVKCDSVCKLQSCSPASSSLRIACSLPIPLSVNSMYVICFLSAWVSTVEYTARLQTDLAEAKRVCLNTCPVAITIGPHDHAGVQLCISQHEQILCFNTGASQFKIMKPEVQRSTKDSHVLLSSRTDRYLL